MPTNFISSLLALNSSHLLLIKLGSSVRSNSSEQKAAVRLMVEVPKRSSFHYTNGKTPRREKKVDEIHKRENLEYLQVLGTQHSLFVILRNLLGRYNFFLFVYKYAASKLPRKYGNCMLNTLKMYKTTLKTANFSTNSVVMHKILLARQLCVLH